MLLDVIENDILNKLLWGPAAENRNFKWELRVSQVCSPLISAREAVSYAARLQEALCDRIMPEDLDQQIWADRYDDAELHRQRGTIFSRHQVEVEVVENAEYAPKGKDLSDSKIFVVKSRQDPSCYRVLMGKNIMRRLLVIYHEEHCGGYNPPAPDEKEPRTTYCPAAS